MLMHATAHTRICTDTVRVSAVTVDSARKIPCRTGESNPNQYCGRKVQSDADDDVGLHVLGCRVDILGFVSPMLN